MVVTVDVELSGLKGRPVLLSWSMWQAGEGTRLYGEWLNTNLAYQLEATESHDTASVDFWIPLPKRHGQYFVRSYLAVPGQAATSADCDPFG